MANDQSFWVETAFGSGAQKLGQPVPLSNLVREEYRFCAAAGTSENAGAMLRVQRTAVRTLRIRLPQDGILVGRQELAPLRIGVSDLVAAGGRGSRGEGEHVPARGDQRGHTGGGRKQESSTTGHGGLLAHHPGAML